MSLYHQNLTQQLRWEDSRWSSQPLRGKGCPHAVLSPGTSWCTPRTACHTLCSSPDTASGTPAGSYLLHQCYLLLPADPTQADKNKINNGISSHMLFQVYLHSNYISISISEVTTKHQKHFWLHANFVLFCFLRQSLTMQRSLAWNS